jgi:hypothetical protein
MASYGPDGQPHSPDIRLKDEWPMLKIILTSVDFGSSHLYGVLVRLRIVPNRAESGRRSLEEGCIDDGHDHRSISGPGKS